MSTIGAPSGDPISLNILSQIPLRSQAMAFMEEVVIVSAVRTPIGKFQGALSDFSAPQLGAIVVREACLLYTSRCV